MKRRAAHRALPGLVLLAACNASGDDPAALQVACAANFAPAFAEIAEAFESASGTRVVWTRGSTGKLYAQIVNGAPFDVFLAADQARVAKLVAAGAATSGSLMTYAKGRLVLTGTVLQDPAQAEATLRRGDYQSLAIAHPKSAPYGAAAVATLRNLKVDIGARLLRGESVAQAFQFVDSGGADLGLVALAQVRRRPGVVYWLVPQRLHQPIAQDAVVLTRARDPVAAGRLLAFMRGPAARRILDRYGYE